MGHNEQMECVGILSEYTYILLNSLAKKDV